MEKRRLGLFWLRLAGFAVVLAATLWYTAYVIMPKNDYGVCAIMNFYRQEPDTIDVLTVGTSVAYAGVNTNVLWSEYGIAAYNLCSAEQPYWITYHYLTEVLKTQHPQLILLDAKASIYTEEHTNRGRTLMNIFGIRDQKTRFEALQASVAEEDFWSFALIYPQLHSYYAEVTADNFVYPPTNGGRGDSWKGYIESDEHEQHQRPSLVWTSIKKPLHEKQETYFRKILELAQAHDVPVMLVGFPNPDYANDHMYYNNLWYIAKEYGVTGINYNDPKIRYGLSYAGHFSDWQHLNVKGSVNFSRKLAADLLQRYDLPDRRDDPAYQSYQACADLWYEKYPEYRKEPVSEAESTPQKARVQ